MRSHSGCISIFKTDSMSEFGKVWKNLDHLSGSSVSQSVNFPECLCCPSSRSAGCSFVLKNIIMEHNSKENDRKVKVVHKLFHFKVLGDVYSLLLIISDYLYKNGITDA